MLSSEVSNIIGLAEEAASGQPDLIAVVVAAIREASTREVDPYLLTGVLLEGVVHAIAEGVPAERRVECALAAARMLTDRMHVWGMI